MKRFVFLLFFLFAGLYSGVPHQVGVAQVATAVSSHVNDYNFNSSHSSQHNQTAVTNNLDTAMIYLPLVMKSDTTPSDLLFDMTQFMVGSGVLYEVRHSSGSQARHQTQVNLSRFYHTKGNEISAEWEELWHTQEFIMRGTDTSPGSGLYYTLRETGQYGSAWSPRYWRVGDVFERAPLVTFYRKTDCVPQSSGLQRTWLQFEAYYPSYTFDSGITLDNVIQLAWLLQPTSAPMERYFYAQDYGLVGWWSNDRGMSYISEIHAPGQRPDNKREIISCLDYGDYTPKGLPAPTRYAK